MARRGRAAAGRSARPACPCPPSSPTATTARRSAPLPSSSSACRGRDHRPQAPARRRVRRRARRAWPASAAERWPPSIASRRTSTPGLDGHGPAGSVPRRPRRPRRAASRLRARASVARANRPPPTTPQPTRRPRRLPHRQPLVGARRPAGRPRLGAGPPRRPARGPRLALRAGLAVRRGRQAGRRLRHPRGAVGGLRGGRRRAVDPDAVRWWEAYGDAQVGGDLHHAGGAPTWLGLSRSVELAAIGRRVVRERARPARAAAGQSDAGRGRGRPRPSASRRTTARRPPSSPRRCGSSSRATSPTATEGRVRFHTRVAVNVLGDDRAGAATRAGARRPPTVPASTGLGYADDAALAAAIRAGELDDRFDEVKAAVWSTVRDKLAVDLPGYDPQSPDRYAHLMRIGMLGGTGPAGSALAARLASVGFDVVIGSRSKYQAMEAVDQLLEPWPDHKLQIGAGDNADGGGGRRRRDRHAVGRRHPDRDVGRATSSSGKVVISHGQRPDPHRQGVPAAGAAPGLGRRVGAGGGARLPRRRRVPPRAGQGAGRPRPPDRDRRPHLLRPPGSDRTAASRSCRRSPTCGRSTPAG